MVDDSNSSSPDPIALSLIDEIYSSPLRRKATRKSATPLKSKSPSTSATPARHSPAQAPASQMQQREFILNTPSKERTGARGERQASPWRIRVTVQAEPHEDAIEEEVDMANSITVPLRGGDESSSVKKRGRPRKGIEGQESAGSPVKKRRVGGPDKRIDEREGRRSAERTGTQNMPVGLKRGRGRPRKNATAGIAAETHASDPRNGLGEAQDFPDEDRGQRQHTPGQARTSQIRNDRPAKHSVPDEDQTAYGTNEDERIAEEPENGSGRGRLRLGSPIGNVSAEPGALHGHRKKAEDHLGKTVSTSRDSHHENSSVDEEDGSELRTLGLPGQKTSGPAMPVHRAPQQTFNQAKGPSVAPKTASRRRLFDFAVLTPLHQKNMSPLPRKPDSTPRLKSVHDRVPTPRKPPGYREDLESPLPASSPVKEALMEAEREFADNHLSSRPLDEIGKRPAFKTGASSDHGSPHEKDSELMSDDDAGVGDNAMWQGMIGEAEEGYDYEDAYSLLEGSVGEEQSDSDEDHESKTRFLPGERTMKESEDFSMVSIDSLPSMQTQASFIGHASREEHLTSSHLINVRADENMSPGRAKRSPAATTFPRPQHPSSLRWASELATPDKQHSSPAGPLSTGGAIQTAETFSPRLPPLLPPLSSPKAETSMPASQPTILVNHSLQDALRVQPGKRPSPTKIDSPFQGFRKDTRRVLSAELQLGVHLANGSDRVRQSVKVHGNEEPTLAHNAHSLAVEGGKDEKFQYSRLLTPSDSEQGEVALSVEHPSMTEQAAPAQPGSTRNADEMSWRITTPERRHVPTAPSSNAKNLEIQWQAERAHVSRQIEEANASQIIVIPDTSQLAAEQGAEAGPEETMTDVWQLEARVGTNTEQTAVQNDETGDVWLEEQPPKPRRSKIPSPWRRESGGMSLIYSDEVEASGVELQVGDGNPVESHFSDDSDEEMHGDEESEAESVGQQVAENEEEGEEEEEGSDGEEDDDDTGLFWQRNLPAVFRGGSAPATSRSQKKIDIADLLGLRNEEVSRHAGEPIKNVQWSSPLKSELILSESQDPEERESEIADAELGVKGKEERELEEDSFDSTSSDVRQLQEEMTQQVDSVKATTPKNRVEKTNSRLQHSSPYSQTRATPPHIRYYDPLRPKKVYPPLFRSPSPDLRIGAPGRTSITLESHTQSSRSRVSRIPTALPPASSSSIPAPTQPPPKQPPPPSAAPPPTPYRPQPPPPKQPGLLSRLLRPFLPTPTPPPTITQPPYPSPNTIHLLHTANLLHLLPFPTSPPFTPPHYALLRALYAHTERLPHEARDDPHTPDGRALLRSWQAEGLEQLVRLLGTETAAKGYVLRWEMWQLGVAAEMWGVLWWQGEIVRNAGGVGNEGSESEGKEGERKREEMGFTPADIANLVFVVVVGKWMREDERAGRREVYGWDVRDAGTDEVVVGDWRGWVCGW